MQYFDAKDGKVVLLKMVKTIQDNKQYLGDIDGLIGDGDHGMNMNKGFTVFETRHGQEDYTLSEGFDMLSQILMNEIGGSMGPIYGTVFGALSEDCEDLEEITLPDLAKMVAYSLSELQDIVDAQVGDKTLVDALSPAADSLKASAEAGESFTDALAKMKAAAEAGRDATKDMVAKFGRSSRLGERSRGVLDAGATSCSLLIGALADGVTEGMKEK